MITICLQEGPATQRDYIHNQYDAVLMQTTIFAFTTMKDNWPVKRLTHDCVTAAHLRACIVRLSYIARRSLHACFTAGSAMRLLKRTNLLKYSIKAALTRYKSQNLANVMFHISRWPCQHLIPGKIPVPLCIVTKSYAKLSLWKRNVVLCINPCSYWSSFGYLNWLGPILSGFKPSLSRHWAFLNRSDERRSDEIADNKLGASILIAR